MQSIVNTDHSGELSFSLEFFQTCFLESFGEKLKVLDAHYIPSPGEEMALKLKYSGDYGHPIGVQKYLLSIEFQGHEKEQYVIVKSKHSDDSYRKILQKTFDSCQIDVGVSLDKALELLEFTHISVKEMAVYAMQKGYPAFDTLLPKQFASYIHQKNHQFILILECLNEFDLSLDVSDTGRWTKEKINLFLNEISILHAAWYKNEDKLKKLQVFSPEVNAEMMVEYQDFWLSIAEAAAIAGKGFLTENDSLLHKHLILTSGDWRSMIDKMDKTLVQNDCVPKNIALCETVTPNKVYIYDWEIAAINIPQRDVCEFLAYVLPKDFSEALLLEYIEKHRNSMSEMTGVLIDKEQWQLGFKCALCDLLIRRVLMQICMEKIKPRNIEQVYKNILRMMQMV